MARVSNWWLRRGAIIYALYSPDQCAKILSLVSTRDLLGGLTWDAPDLPHLLAAAARHRLTDAASLLQLHERLLFIRAYPASPKIKQMADRLLFSFARRIDEFRAAGEDLAAFEDPAVSGIAGTSFSAVFSYEVARRLAGLNRCLEIDWENFDQSAQFGAVLRRFLPLLDEDWPVEAHVPFRAWVAALKDRDTSDLKWLLKRIARLSLPERDRAELYESLELLLVWRIGDSPKSRSRLRLPVRRSYYHRQALIRRSDISLERELSGPPLPITRLSRSEARKALDLILETSAMRYRELYGFTHPDARRVFRADVGRGAEILFFAVPPSWRLPLRAYHCGMFFKNGVPAGYVELLSFFERSEVGFNLYYTFREGESAWLYAGLLRLFRQVLGVTCFSVDPYQIGLENDEALDSGAFWFYRKLGFRPLDPTVLRLVEREECRMKLDAGYRSSRRTLAQLARSHLMFESPGAEQGAWDCFRIRTLAMAIQKRMQNSDCALTALLRAIPNFSAWTGEEQASAELIVSAKYDGDEARYLRLMQRHARLRAAALKLGSSKLEEQTQGVH